MKPKNSVIIPNWNGIIHLEACLNSLVKQSINDCEIIVVDNASTDGSQDFICENYPAVRLFQLEENRGFTGACNAGYEASTGEYIILLNNDTEVAPDWLEQLNLAFEKQPQAGILASKILLYDRRDTLHAAGDYYQVNGIPGNRGVWQVDVGQYDEVEVVFSACGAAAAFRRSMIQEIGFLDEAFYFSCEDVDLGWRAQLSGWQVVYVPSAVVYHKLKATGGSVIGSYFDGRNFLYLIWKNYPWSLLKRYWPKILRAQLKITWNALKAWRGPAARARLMGQLVGFLTLYRMFANRRRIQASRQIDDAGLLSVLTEVD